MITTILLDLDDTILDFHKAEKEALKKALHKIGVEPTEALLKRYSEINLSQWKLLELGKLTHAEVKINRYRIFFEECGIYASPEETAKCYEHNLAYEHEKVEGALELLQKLHGKYRLYAASNGTYEVQKRRIREQRENQSIKSILPNCYVIENLKFDFERLCFFKGEEELSLSRNEQKLLQIFLKNQGRILTREILMERLWQDGAEFVDENALSVTINRLRKKIEGETKYIQTVYGQGYIWRKEE